MLIMECMVPMTISLEGLRQASNLFSALNVTTLVEKLEFKRFETESCFFVKHTSKGLIILLVWVDDFAAGVSSLEVWYWFIKSYAECEGMDIVDEGALTKFAGVQVEMHPDYVQSKV